MFVQTSPEVMYVALGVLVGLVALGIVCLAAAALFSARARARIAPRYPLAWVSAVLLVPFTVALLYALAFAFPLGMSRNLDVQDAIWVLAPSLGFILCIWVGVWCARAQLGRMNSLRYLPAVAGFGAPLLLWLSIAQSGSVEPFSTWAAVTVALTCGGNGLLAVWVNEYRRSAATS